MIKLNLGCGNDYREGWINCDISKQIKADRYFDIRKRLPFENESVGEIYCSGVLEQILANEDFLKVMNECHRILEAKGKFTIIVPSARYSNSFKDPFDCRHFTEETFDYFEKDNRYHKLYGKVYGFLPWKIGNRATNERGIMTIVLYAQ